MKYAIRALVVISLFFCLLFFQYKHEPSEPMTSRFIKLDTHGKAKQPWQGPWACILDTKTGLIWENKTDDESIHDGLWTYSWKQKEVGVDNSGDCYFETERCDTDDLIRRMNIEKTCGLDNWRLPSVAELSTLVNENPKVGQAKIFNDFFPFTKRGDYWSSDHGIPLTGVYGYLKEGAYAFDFIEGKPRPIPYRNAAFVRLVTKTLPNHLTEITEQ